MQTSSMIPKQRQTATEVASAPARTPLSVHRRTVLSTALAGVGASAVGLSSWPTRLLALTQSGAEALVDKLVADINKVIATSKSESAKIRDFEKIFSRYADTAIMARYVLGADVRRASPAQLRAFTDAFEKYIANKYGRRFREFIGGTVTVTGARPIKAGYEVKAIAKLKGEAPFAVSFLVSDKSGSGKFYNMFIEGVNMLLTERTEIGAIMDQNGGSLDKTIAYLKRG